jgi:hypothetical protein
MRQQEESIGATEEEEEDPHPPPQIMQRLGAAQELLRGAILGPAFRHWLHGFSFWEDGVPRAAIDIPAAIKNFLIRLRTQKLWPF